MPNPIPFNSTSPSPSSSNFVPLLNVMQEQRWRFDQTPTNTDLNRSVFPTHEVSRPPANPASSSSTESSPWLSSRRTAPSNPVLPLRFAFHREAPHPNQQSTGNWTDGRPLWTMRTSEPDRRPLFQAQPGNTGNTTERYPLGFSYPRIGLAQPNRNSFGEEVSITLTASGVEFRTPLEQSNSDSRSNNENREQMATVLVSGNSRGSSEIVFENPSLSDSSQSTVHQQRPLLIADSPTYHTGEQRTISFRQQ